MPTHRALVAAVHAGVRYFCETMDGNFEEAFRLCACNHEPGSEGERAREKPEIVELALTGRIRLAAHAVTLKISVDSNTPPLVSHSLRERPECYPSSRIGRFGAVSVSIGSGYRAELVS